MRRATWMCAILTTITLHQTYALQAAPGTQLIITSDQQISAPDPIGSTLKEVNQSFDYDFTHYASIAKNQQKAYKVANILSHVRIDDLKQNERQVAGQLFLKLGAFRVNTGRTDIAIPLLKKAARLLVDKYDMAMAFNYLALAHERDYATTNNENNMEHALTYTQKVIRELYPDALNDAVAFAYCIQGLTYNNAGNMLQAELAFKRATDIYNKLPVTEMSVRAKNKYSAILIAKKEQTDLAIAQLKQINSYWQAQSELDSTPYAARYFLTLGKAYLQAGELNKACEEFARALPIYKKFYGAKNLLLEEPYYLLKKCNKQNGNPQMARLYDAKLKKLKNTFR